MKTKMWKWNVVVVFVFVISLFTACQKDEPMGSGQAEIQLTDAPSDDESIKSVFVTVAEVRIDGQAVAGFTKQTIDLKAFQEGNVKSLATAQLNAGVHNQITFVLDVDADANGNAPGCYVQTVDNAKYKLGTSGKIEIVAAKAWSVAANAKSTIVADFNIRKAIRWSADNAMKYAFVSNANLQASVRVVDQMSAGTLSGTYTEHTSSNADKIIVYAYKQGTFNASTETQAQGEDAIYFANSVSSAEVKGMLSQSYKLAFLEQGEYELHFASYSYDSNTNRFTFQGMLTAQTSVNGSVADYLSVSGNTTLSVSSVINF